MRNENLLSASCRIQMVKDNRKNLVTQLQNLLNWCGKPVIASCSQIVRRLFSSFHGVLKTFRQTVKPRQIRFVYFSLPLTRNPAVDIQMRWCSSSGGGKEVLSCNVTAVGMVVAEVAVVWIDAAPVVVSIAAGTVELSLITELTFTPLIVKSAKIRFRVAP